MKVALIHFNNVDLRPVVLKLIKEFNITELHNFWALPAEYSIEDQLPSTVKIYNHYAEVCALLAGKLDISGFIPLDQQLLKKMAPDEHMSKRTMQRWAKNYPQLFNPGQKGIYRLIDKWLLHVGYRYNSKALSYNETHDIYLRVARYFNHFFKSREIDLYLGELIPHGGIENIAYSVAKSIALPSVYGYFTPATFFQFFMNDYAHMQDQVPALIEKIKQQGPVDPGKFREYSRNELKRLTASSSEQTLPFVGDFKKIKQVQDETMKQKKVPAKIADQILADMLPKPTKKDLFYDRVADFIIKRFGKKKAYQRQWDNLFARISVQPDLTKNFIYVPLHFQPEASSDPIGDYYSCQQLIVEMLAYHVPKDWIIYVKEHRRMTDNNYRPLEFYKTLAALPNVFFVDKDYSTFKLIENCRAVGALTSTAGWEGLFKNKPFLMFGNLLTQYAPGVFRIESNDDCKRAIEAIQKGVDIKLEDLLYFMKAMEEISIPVNSTRYNATMHNLVGKEWEDLLLKGYAAKIRSTLEPQMNATA